MQVQILHRAFLVTTNGDKNKNDQYPRTTHACCYYSEVLMNILHLSDSALHPTGYANQTRNLGRTVHEAGHGFYALGHNHGGQPSRGMTLEDGEQLPFWMLGTDGSKYARNVIPEFCKSYNIDAITILMDTFPLLKEDFLTWNLPAKTAFWFPSDGGWFPKLCERVLKRVDHPVAMAKFGQDQLKRLHGMKCHYIPHGVRTDLFRPMGPARRAEIRDKYGDGQLFAVKNNTFWPLKLDLREKFILGCVARNQGRKNLPETIQAFCKFAENHEDVLLVMHSDPVDGASVCDLQEVADRSGQGHKIVWTGMRIANPYTTARLAELYNLFDAFYLTTSGEGFGIPFIEAMACEVPVIATEFTTVKEIVLDNDAGLPVKLMGEPGDPYPHEKPMNGVTIGTWEVSRALPDLYDCVAKLEWAYQNREKLRALGKNGRAAIMREYDWNGVVGPEWMRFLKQITEEGK